MNLRTVVHVSIALSLAGCASPMQPQNGMLPAAAARSSAPLLSGSGSLAIVVKLPGSERMPHYFGPATKGMTVAITGPTKIKATVGLTVTANGCKSKLTTIDCTLVVPNLKACPSTKKCYDATVTTYDAYARGRIPVSAHVLSENKNLKFSVGSGQSVLPMVLYGAPHAVAFLPAGSSALTGTQSNGYVFPKCNGSAQSVSLVAQDADGNFIVGVGAPALSLTSNNPSQLAVSGSGGHFVLSPPVSPAYPYGGHTVALTATAKAPASGGGASASTPVNVTYSADICGVFTEYNVPSGSSSAPFGITTGSDGALWFTEDLANKIGRVTTDGTFKEYGGLSPSAQVVIITSGPDGNLWFNEQSVSKIGKMTPSGNLTEYPTTTPNAEPIGVTQGPDGNMWFVESSGSANNVASISTGGTIHEYAIGTPGASPQSLVTGPDGALWFPELGTDSIGRATVTGSVSSTAIPTSSSQPQGIAVGSDGAIWFTETNASKIGRIQPNIVPVVDSEFPTPEAAAGPILIAPGPDGNLWFTELSGNRIASISPAGTFREFSVPTPGADPAGITTGPDGAIWFTEVGKGKIGQLR